MPYAVTHVLIVLILLELFRDYYVKDKKAFPLHYVLIGGLAGLIPDLDLAISYLLYFFGFNFIEIHRIFLHNLFVPLLFILIAIPFWKFKSKKLGQRHLKLKNILLILAFGFFIHLLLDAIIAGIIMPFYPFSTFFVGLNLITLFPIALQGSILPSLDAILLVLWLIHLEVRHKISSFI
jgi:membrane-bound metal-dependent hydrolase YbcI (DUF457 family)